MFALPAVELSTKAHSSGDLWLGEVPATYGLLLVIFAVVRSGRTSAAPRLLRSSWPSFLAQPRGTIFVCRCARDRNLSVRSRRASTSSNPGTGSTR